MNDDNNKKRNPVQRLWNFLSSIGGIVGLSSLAENWMSDLIKWKGWIATVIDSYQNTIYPASDWLLGWLPWTIPSWLVDYFVLGGMFVTSVAKGLVPPENDSSRPKFLDIRWCDIPILIAFYIGQLIFWPYIFFLIARNYIFERASDFRNTLLWFGAIVLGFIVLLSLNSTL